MDDNCEYPNTVKFLVGNKSDIDKLERRVDIRQGKMFAEKHSLQFFETSALLNDGSISDLFKKLSVIIKQTFDESQLRATAV